MEERKFELPEKSIFKVYGDKKMMGESILLAKGKALVDFLQSKKIACSLVDVYESPSLFTIELNLESAKPSDIYEKSSEIADLFDTRSVRVVPNEKMENISIEIGKKWEECTDVGLKPFIPLLKNNSKMKLPIAIGIDSHNEPVVFDLTDLGNVLIGEGDNSEITMIFNTIISSILLTKTPDDVRFLIANPNKKYEHLVIYKDIPHLLKPIALDAKTTVMLLTDCVNEMEDRYNKMSSIDIDSLPTIVLVIDDVICAMERFSNEFMKRFHLLAERASQVGIYMVYSISGLSNISSDMIMGFPTRVAFHMYSNENSQKIVDSGDAEFLNNQGDMLFKSGDGEIRRIKTTFISKKEVAKLVSFWKDQNCIIR